VDRNLHHAVDLLAAWAADVGIQLTALLGPQHGLRGEKQDNMVESEHFTDPATGLPVFSLYGETRRVTPEMADHVDVLLVDLQDVGVRVYTFLTTLGYILEDFQAWPEKEVWVLDRPNPVGRAVEGLTLEPGWESFVGIASVPMQHGMTLGEFARWYHHSRGLTSRLTVVPMQDWSPQDPRRAWPASRVWLQPSPNMPALYTARAYPGTVMLEGTTLSEARGTTRPLSTLGHPELDRPDVLDLVAEMDEAWRTEAGTAADTHTAGSGTSAPDYLFGCRIRPVTFEPTFHKHAGVPTQGIEIIAEGPFYDPARFRPYRLIAALLKAIRRRHPELPLWTDPPYEYEFDKIPIDVITGGTRFREWVEDPQAQWGDLEAMLQSDEAGWREMREDWLLY
jgi:uncharacterized protein YbbC (DUF1343 family)